jgi:hypothetical protein
MPNKSRSPRLRGKPWRAYIISASVGAARPVLEEQHNQIQPSWSPDGQSLIISYLHWLETTTPGIIVVHLDIQRVKRLPDSKNVWEAVWSQRGWYIAARTLDLHAIMLFDLLLGSGWKWERAIQSFLQWSADGHYVYFKRMGNQAAILRVCVKNRRVEEIVSLRNIKYTRFTGGTWFGLTPDGSPLLLHDTGTEEIYALDWKAPKARQ